MAVVLEVDLGRVNRSRGTNKSRPYLIISTPDKEVLRTSTVSYTAFVACQFVWSSSVCEMISYNEVNNAEKLKVLSQNLPSG